MRTEDDEPSLSVTHSRSSLLVSGVGCCPIYPRWSLREMGTATFTSARNPIPVPIASVTPLAAAVNIGGGGGRKIGTGLVRSFHLTFLFAHTA